MNNSIWGTLDGEQWSEADRRVERLNELALTVPEVYLVLSVHRRGLVPWIHAMELLVILLAEKTGVQHKALVEQAMMRPPAPIEIHL